MTQEDDITPAVPGTGENQGSAGVAYAIRMGGVAALVLLLTIWATLSVSQPSASQPDSGKSDSVEAADSDSDSDSDSLWV